MKKFGEYLKDKMGSTPVAIHFRQAAPRVVEPKRGVIPEPIHFKQLGTSVSKFLKKLKEDIGDQGMISDWKKKNDNEHLGKDPATISAKLQKDNKFTDNHRDIIDHYTGDDNHSKDMNRPLIHGFKSETHEKNLRPMYKALDSAIDKNKIKKPMSLYSGLSFNPQEHTDEEGKLHSPAYISATHDKTLAHGYAEGYIKPGETRHIMHLHVEPGDPVSHVSGESDFGDEHESIVKRGQTLQHLGYEEHADPKTKSTYRIHHVKILRDQ